MARVALIIGPMFEDSEFRKPYEAVRGAGHEAIVVGTSAKQELEGKSGREKITPDRAIGDVSVDDFDALVIPGGYSPDHLRTDAQMVSFTRDFVASGKPVAAICHGPSLLLEADVVRGRQLTSWPSIKTDLTNAGAHWVDREVVEDENLITSRKPDDLVAFCGALLQSIGRD
jgi:protease I